MRGGRFVSLGRSYFARLRDTFSEESDQHGRSYQIQEEFGRVPYVVLDDLGVQRGTAWEEEVLYDLVDTRYSQERFTVVTTNEPLEEIQAMSRGRIYSRLQERCKWVELSGPDWRSAA
ncbi:ATP-binding protein [Candidatus Latescibacterota bacterium]